MIIDDKGRLFGIISSWVFAVMLFFILPIMFRICFFAQKIFRPPKGMVAVGAAPTICIDKEEYEKLLAERERLMKQIDKLAMWCKEHKKAKICK